MSQLYHGSSTAGIKRINPKPSTHGTFVYATSYKELAVIFSGMCGDDMTYTIYREVEDMPWQLVERIPHGFETMYSNSSSIYTLDDATFKDINTNFAEMVSEVSVDTLGEERISNVYDKLEELEQKGVIQLYDYPNKPKQIPIDDSDLIEKEINQATRNNKELEKNAFKRLLYLHPNLLPQVNNKLLERGIEPYKTDELTDIFEEFLVKQLLNLSREQYLKSSFIAISNTYPSLVPKLQEKISLLDKDKITKTNYIINYISKKYPAIPRMYFEDLKKSYDGDNRAFSEITKDFIGKIKNVVTMENNNVNNQEINLGARKK